MDISISEAVQPIIIYISVLILGIAHPGIVNQVKQTNWA